MTQPCPPKQFMGATVRTLFLRVKNSVFTSKSNPARLFSSSPASAAESEIYRRALKLQRPTTVKYHEILHNSVSLIGIIERPLKEFNTSTGKFGYHTSLRVKASVNPRRSFRVLLKFWDEMAEISVQHLKQHEFVYVSGNLRSNAKADVDGKYAHYYEVNVLEINFVSQHGLGPGNQNSVQLESQVSYEDIMQRRRTRLHLWHLFFASPNEWWDDRNNKLYPNSPDFKHKDTGEKLWLTDRDPPWIKQQLDLLDSRLGKQNHGEPRNNWSYLSPLVFDDAKRA